MVKALVLLTRDPGFDSRASTVFLFPLLIIDGEAVKMLYFYLIPIIYASFLWCVISKVVIYASLLAVVDFV